MAIAEAILAEGKVEVEGSKEEPSASHFRLAAEEIWKASKEGNKDAFLDALEAAMDIKKAES